jgi:hypothetical protein
VSNRRASVLLLALLSLVLASTAAAAAVDRSAGGGLPAPDAARGLVFDGLFPGEADGPCEGLLRVSAPGLSTAPGLAGLCTHGPDAAPAGVDVRVAQAAPVDGATAAAAADAFQCDGDGSSGLRAEAIYVNIQGTTSRFATYEASFTAWAAEVQRQVADSTVEHDPAATPLHYRFVHTPTGGDGSCELVVRQETLSSRAASSFDATINELQALGYDDPARDYLIWMDANTYCGIGTLYGDTRADPATNRNNGYAASYARADAACWDYAESHELLHNIGAVQNNAPNASGGYHCNDGYDVMCYDDGGSKADYHIDPDCWESRFRTLLDCNGDDYFHPSPAAGSYLDTYWNTADSGFLFAHDVGGGDPPPEDPEPTPDPVAPVARDDTATVEEGATVTVDVLANDSDDDGDIDAGTLSIVTDASLGSAGVAGSAVAYIAPAVDADAIDTFRYEICDSGGRCATATVTVTVTALDAGPTDDGPTTVTFTGSLNKKRTSETHTFTVTAAGAVTVTLPVQEKGNGNGRKGGGKETASWTLELLDSAGDVVSTNGSEPPTLRVDVSSAGTYAVRVSGGQGGYELVVEHP